jgi:hypothetical protein
MSRRIQEKLQQAVGSPGYSSVVAVSLCVLIAYVAFTVIALGIHQWNPLWFVWIGERYADLDAGGRTGYDGQFAYYIARDGGAALPHLDNAPYRLQRILFPAIAGVLSWGNSALVPWVMIAENLTAIVLTTYLLAGWLREKELSPWYALMYSFYIGTLMAYSRDLTELLAICLVTFGVVLWLRGMYARAVIALALALLAKETMLLFVFGIIASALVQKNSRLVLYASVSVLPLAFWQGYLLMRFGALPIVTGPSLVHIPLAGILSQLTLEPGRVSSLLFVGLPGLALLCFSILYLFRDAGRSPAGWWLLFNSLLVVLMPLGVYDHIMHAGRNAAGMVLSVLFLLPVIGRSIRVALLCYWVLPSVVWLAPILRWAPWLSRL